MTQSFGTDIDEASRSHRSCADPPTGEHIHLKCVAVCVPLLRIVRPLSSYGLLQQE